MLSRFATFASFAPLSRRGFSTRAVPYLRVKNCLGIAHVPTHKILCIEEGKTAVRLIPYYELYIGDERSITVKEGNPAYPEVKQLIEFWKQPPDSGFLE